MRNTFILSELADELSSVGSQSIRGRITAVGTCSLTASLEQAAMHDLVRVERRKGPPIFAEVTALRGATVSLAPFGETGEIVIGALVEPVDSSLDAKLYPDEFGLVVDSLGKPLPLSRQPSGEGIPVPIFAEPPHPLSRGLISKQIVTGITNIDALHPLGYGQRIGLFAAAGLGKSTLLGMLARSEGFDVVVAALVGERGREVREFIEEALGESGMRKAVVVVSTGDEVPAQRRLAPFTATAIAEFYRNQGKRVLLVVDSLTRTARAIRDLSLASGDTPIRQGYTSAVYDQLPRLVERAGALENGSITALYTILTQSFQELDPLADELKSLLDGHLVLSQQLVSEGIRPAIHPIDSVSRLTQRLLNHRELKLAERVKSIGQEFLSTRGVLGGLSGATSGASQTAVRLRELLHQTPSELRALEETRARIEKFVSG